MRAWLIRWLGIESNDKSIWKMLAALDRRIDEVRKECSNANYRADCVLTAQVEKINRIVHVERDLREIAKRVLEDRVNNEVFLNQIIDRIQKVQL